MTDLASFINYIKQKRPELKSAKVVLIGGSYTGTLVSWFRVKYPELTVGAWSSSGVVDTRADFTIYKVISGEDYRSAGGNECYNAIHQTFVQLEAWADDKRGDLIEENFKLCDPLNYDNRLDVQAFFNVLGWNLAEINQILRANQTAAICDFILNDTLHETPLQGIANVIHGLVGPCIPGRFADIVGILNRTELEAPASVSYRQWFYQLCSGMGLFWTTSSPNQPFGTKVPIEFWSAMCTAVYGKTYTPAMIENEAKKLRDKYGGNDKAKFTHVYTSQGRLDPWRGGGVVKDVGPTSPTYVIEDAAHCFDINTFNQDLPGVVVSQSKVVNEMEKWLSGDGVKHKPVLFTIFMSVIFSFLHRN